MLKTAQKTAMYRDPTMAAATQVGAQAEAMKAAASNEAAPATDGWKCSCGTVNSGKFCGECGKPRTL